MASKQRDDTKSGTRKSKNSAPKESSNQQVVARVLFAIVQKSDIDFMILTTTASEFRECLVGDN